MTTNPKRQLRTPEAADYLRLSASTLAKQRLRGDGPVYQKCGPRIVVYDVDDLDAWLRSRRRRSTSDAGPAVGAPQI
jgi:predicted DNA-binding transcriptional regulator AlpA